MSAEEIEAAEKYRNKKVEEEHFPEKKRALLNKQPFPSKSIIKSIEDGIIRVGGRFQISQLEYAETHPIILPGENHFLDLLIMDCHKRVGHASTLTEV